MSSTRLVLRRNSRPLDLCLPSSYLSQTRIVKCSLRLGSDGQNQKSFTKDKERKSPVEVKACLPSSGIVVGSKTQVRRGLLELVFLVTQVTDIVVKELRQAIKRQAWKLQLQTNIEKVIINCRFFTLLAVGGTLMGSVLCFLEGCCLVLVCYTHYLNGLSHGAKENTIYILIEALDMFLFGTSMLLLGMGIHNMFVSCRTNKSNQPHACPRGFLSSTESIGEAKTKIGYAMVMILHVGMVEKFKTTPLVTCVDLACSAASLFISSASMFLFARLSSSLN